MEASAPGGESVPGETHQALQGAMEKLQVSVCKAGRNGHRAGFLIQQTG